MAHVVGYTGTVKQLAQVVGRLQYDVTAQYVAAVRDRLFPHRELHTHDAVAAVTLDLAINHINKAWDICKPYMANGDCVKHSRCVFGQSLSIEQLAQALRTKAPEFLDELALDLSKQSFADAARGRLQLSDSLDKASEYLMMSSRRLAGQNFDGTHQPK